MLVLTRKKGESIVIDGGITIQVANIDGNNVRLAINAPKNIRIYREEIYEQIQSQNKASVRNTKDVFSALKNMFRNQ